MIQKNVTQTTEQTYTPHPEQDIIENVPMSKNDYIIQDYDTTSAAPIRTYQLIWFGLGVIETLMVFRFILKMVGANTYSGFTDFVYMISYPFALPFQGILPITGNGVMILEWSTLIGMAVYIVIAYGLLEIVQLLTPLPQQSTRSVTKRTRYAV